MLVFVDESGDAGFKIGSSPCLVMALIMQEIINNKIADKWFSE